MPNETIIVNQPILIFADGTRITIGTYRELCLHEDINQLFMNGYVIIPDTGEISNLVIGGEIINIKLDSPLEEGDVDLNFVIYGKDCEQIDTRGVRHLKLMFTSPETLLARTKRICKAWEKDVPSIIKDILDMVPTERSIEVTAGSTTYNYIAPNISCEQAIKDLLPLAYDAEGYPYVVFENTQGIQIKSIKELFGNYNSQAKFEKSTVKQLKSTTRIPVEERSLILDRCQIYRNNDLMQILNRSALSSSATCYNTYTRTVETHSFNIQDRNPYDGSISHKQFDEKMLSKQTGEDNGESTMDVTGQIDFYANYAQNRGFRKSISTLSGAVRVEFEQIHGTLLHRVGETVNLAFDSQLDPNDGEGRTAVRTEKLGGRYLITKVAHLFVPLQINNSLEIVEAVKLGYGEAV